MGEVNPGLVIAFIVAVVTVVAHTGALFYWGGSLTTKVKELDRRVTKIERP